MSAATGRVAITKQGTAQLPSTEHMLVAANVVIKRGWDVARNASGYGVPVTAATGLTSGGIALADIDTTSSGLGGSDGDYSIEVEVGVLDQQSGTSGDALTNANIGAVVYGIDNQTVGATSGSGARSAIGICMGLNGDTGNVRTWVGKAASAVIAAKLGSASPTLQSGTATLVAGTVTITGNTLTANSRIFPARKTPAGTVGDLSAPSASRNTGTGAFVINSANASDTSTVDYLIVG